ncbi:MAG TPA: DNA-processing protein DprA, partial [Pseudomonadales bacterium]|nr:DNA-processing protein DprA [Pseudomonadales bacterium]
MSDEYETRCLLSLLALPGVGEASVLRLQLQAGSAAAALQMSSERLRELGLRSDAVVAVSSLRGQPDARSAHVCEWLQRQQIAALGFTSDHYPALLRHTASPPPLLFVRGALEALLNPQVAIVGSRGATVSGCQIAREIATGLAHYGLTVTSGLALGIDAAAHQGAVDAGARSVAVLGCGPDRVYPARHRRLASALLEHGGALVSEFVPGTLPEPGNFPRRNRIISGLSLGVLVVEAALPSGSLLTARCALEQDREVMAVPGPVRSRYSRGCHELLRNGAALIETAEDVLQALGDRFRPKVSAPATPAP